MTTRFHPAALLMGAIFTVLGFVFLLEAAGLWSFRPRDLVYVGPAVLIAVGGVLVVAAFRRN